VVVRIDGPPPPEFAFGLPKTTHPQPQVRKLPRELKLIPAVTQEHRDSPRAPSVLREAAPLAFIESNASEPMASPAETPRRSLPLEQCELKVKLASHAEPMEEVQTENRDGESAEEAKAIDSQAPRFLSRTMTWPHEWPLRRAAD
jgi:hypothetical protein